MKTLRITLTIACVALGISCATTSSQATGSASAGSAPLGSLAQIYYWRAKPGKFEEYTRYVRDVAEPIDAEAHRRGAFVSLTTYMTQDTASAWTHMHVFILRDSAQLSGLSAALERSRRRLEPDSTKRSQRAQYLATLRDRVGAATVSILR